MKALWIRVEAHAVDSVVVAKLAEALGCDPVTALGHYVSLGGAVAEHLPDGKIADVPDAALERWARWSGERGRLAIAVREIFQGADGEFDDWRDSMGHLVEKREKDRRRKASGNSAEVPRSESGDSSATVRDGTERNENTPTSSCGALAEFAGRVDETSPGIAQQFRAHLLAHGGTDATYSEALGLASKREKLTPAHVAEAMRDFARKGKVADLVLWGRFLDNADREPPTRMAPTYSRASGGRRLTANAIAGMQDGHKLD